MIFLKDGATTFPADCRHRRCTTNIIVQEHQPGPAVPTVTGIPYPHNPPHHSVGPRKIGGLTSLRQGLGIRD
jgi:hypothetical protein